MKTKKLTYDDIKLNGNVRLPYATGEFGKITSIYNFTNVNVDEPIFHVTGLDNHKYYFGFKIHS